jgi:hypothetical protein
MYQMAIKYPNVCKYSKRPLNIPIFFNLGKAFENLPKLGIFGLKRNHLATLVSQSVSRTPFCKVPPLKIISCHFPCTASAQLRRQDIFAAKKKTLKLFVSGK